MDECILVTKKLIKYYGNKKALDNINVSIRKGKIYGLVGQNGAGKTTLMRIISGLVYPTDGTVELFSVSDQKGLEEQRKRIGSMIENSAFYPYMTAEENMEAMRISHGIPDKKIIKETLAQVKLNNTENKKVQDLSMGMKQRLGIAMTLLNNPEFLILDEPTNGLDPISIVEIRDMLIELANSRLITIMISSHALEQLYQFATDYIIMHEGKIVQCISKKELDSLCKRHIALQVDNVEVTTTVLERELKTRNYKIMPDNSIALYDYVDGVQEVILALLNNQIKVRDITTKGDSLENYFVNIIGEAHHD